MDGYDALLDVIDSMAVEIAKGFLIELGDSGDAVAQCLLVDCLDDGSRVVRLLRPRAIKRWYRRFAAQGFDRAEFFLGSMTAHASGARASACDRTFIAYQTCVDEQAAGAAIV